MDHKGWTVEVREEDCIICDGEKKFGLRIGNFRGGDFVCRDCIRTLAFELNPFPRKYEEHPNELLELYLNYPDTMHFVKQDIAMELVWRKKDRRKKK